MMMPSQFISKNLHANGSTEKYDVLDGHEKFRDPIDGDFISKIDSCQMNKIIHAFPDAMIVMDSRGMVLFFNAAAEQIFGFGKHEVLNQSIGKLMSLPAGTRQDIDIVSYFGSEDVTGGQRFRHAVGVRRDGTSFPYEMIVDRIRVQGKQVFVAFIRDLEEQEQSARQLRSLYDDLLHLSRVGAMGVMAAALAHELNQPLAAITSFVQTAAALLRSGGTIESTCGALDAAATEALRSANIVRRLRAFVMRDDLQRSFEHLSRLIEDAMTLAMAGAAEMHVRSEVDLDGFDPLVCVDRIQMQQVLVNLIRNAIDAMRGGGGTIFVRARPAGRFAEIIVADTGPGLGAGQCSQLFDAFVTGKQDGLGIGLAICKMIVEAHGGKISARNQVGGGAAFCFTLPLTEGVS
ncbi:ATP-binding protein [Sphingomonas sp. BGYR3]|uniref:sensor histidine kinase n=1 Tax=Sphingomonas sp. BGYR3 TaxID=2975483 RepID=UPI0021A484E6|nr:ATP-binding protein [Sphingomonas sp. BGYR3]MDG5488817.1 ATP-binding protein [Sphingomonas sp. BGYR3]